MLQIGILYAFSFIGASIQRLFDLSIPGSIIGMVLLFLLLLFKIVPIWWIEKGSTFLLRDLTLLFVPITVGIMDYFSLFQGKGIFIVVVVIVSTIMVFVTSGLISQWVAVTLLQHKTEQKTGTE